MMKLFAFMLVFIAAPVWGQGWNDFALILDDGFAIHKHNSMDVVLAYEASEIDRVIIGGGKDGPIHRYAEIKTHIAVHCLLDQESRYFLVTKSDRVVVGPLTEARLQAEPALVGVVLNWKRTVRPGLRWLPYAGIGLMLIVVIGVVLNGRRSMDEYYGHGRFSRD